MNEPDDEVKPKIQPASAELIQNGFERIATDAPEASSSGVRTTDLRPLLIPVPPMIEEALGYTGSSRFVAFFWKPNPLRFCWFDSRESRTSSYGNVWNAFAQHRRVYPFLAQLSLGSAELDAHYWLLLDRLRRLFLCGRAHTVATFLRSVPNEILSAESDGSDAAHLSIIQAAMVDLVAGWLDEDC